MKKLLIVLFTLIVSLTFAQENIENKSGEKYKIAFHLPLTGWMDFTSPSINFGIEKTLNKKFSLYQEIGYINDNFNPLYDLIHPRDFNGFKTSFEPRYFFDYTSNSGSFVSIMFSYKFYAVKEKDAEFSRFGGQYFQFIDYTKNYNVFSFTPKMGTEIINPGKKVGVEISGGVGFRIMKIRHSNNIPADAELISRWDRLIVERSEGRYIRPTAIFRVSLFFIQGKKEADTEDAYFEE